MTPQKEGWEEGPTCLHIHFRPAPRALCGAWDSQETTSVFGFPQHAAQHRHSRYLLNKHTNAAFPLREHMDTRVRLYLSVTVLSPQPSENKGASSKPSGGPGRVRWLCMKPSKLKGRRDPALHESWREPQTQGGCSMQSALPACQGQKRGVPGCENDGQALP